MVADDAAAAEPGDDGSFQLSRTGPTDTALSVNVSVTGTAKAGSDYGAIGATVTFAIGSSTASVPVTVLDDAEVESPETVTLTVDAGAGYTVDDPASATVTITSDDQADLTMLPSSIDFGDVPVNGSRTRSFAVRNDGDSAVSIGPVDLDQNDFTCTNPARSLAPGGVEFFSVTYTPTVAGAATTTQLPIPVPGYAGSVTLTGSGTENANILQVGDGFAAVDEGGQLVLPISLDLDEDIFSITFDIEYDTSVLTATAVDKVGARVPGNLAPDPIDDASGRIVVSLVDMTPAAVVTAGVGKVFDVTFTIDQGAAAGTFPVIMVNPRSILRLSGPPMVVAAQHGEVRLADIGCGDVNGDEEFDVFDLVLIYRYMQGFPILVPTPWRVIYPDWPTDPEIGDNIEAIWGQLDVNEDGVVDVFDLVLIYRYMQGFPTLVPAPWRIIYPDWPPDQVIGDNCAPLFDCAGAQPPQSAVAARRAPELPAARVAADSPGPEPLAVNDLVVGSVTVTPGQQAVIVPIELELDRDLFSLSFDITYDTTVLDAVALTRNTDRVLADPAPSAIDNANGRIIVSVIDLSAQTVVTAGAGEVFYLEFNVATDAAAGDYPVTPVNIRDVIAVDGTRPVLTGFPDTLTVNIVTAAVADAWWTSEVDEDEDGYVRSARLKWDPEVVGSTGSLTVFEKIYRKLASSGDWGDPVETTSSHTITGTGRDDLQYYDCEGEAHGEYDWKIEIYLAGQGTPSDTREPVDDPHLDNCKMETAQEDTPPPSQETAEIKDAWWVKRSDKDGDGYARSAYLKWEPDVAGSNESLVVYERIYRRKSGRYWVLVATTGSHWVYGDRLNNSQDLLVTGTDHNKYDWKTLPSHSFLRLMFSEPF